MKTNANRGTPRGRKAIRASIAAYGAGRSIVTDRAGVIIAGHHTAAAADEAGLARQIVESDGSALVVVRRTDLAADESTSAQTAARLAIADNRVGELNRRWDPARLLVGREMLTDGAVPFFAPLELAELQSRMAREAGDQAPPEDADTVRIVFETDDQRRRWSGWIARLAARYPDETTDEGRVMRGIPEAAG